MSLSTPIVFIIFRRPDLTANVFKAIRQAQPSKLLVVADGPRDEAEALLCQQTRAVIEQIDWDCEVLRNYADENLGCRKRVSSGLDWAFGQVEEAIILEDDCLPHPSFFKYCQELLAHFRDDTRIWCIHGNNFQDGKWRGDGSYYFSHYNHCWGWASWQRAWKHYDKGLEVWPALMASGLLRSIFEDPYEQQYWTKIWNRLYTENQPNTWDYQWTFTCMSNSGLSISPNVNLVSNIGFRTDGTHTISDSNLAAMPVSELGEIQHPLFVIRDADADRYTYDYVLGGQAMRKADTLASRTRQRLSQIKKSLSLTLPNI
jgi:hypothetical protein